MESEENLIKLIADILDLSRYEANKELLHLEKNSLKETIIHTEKEFKPLIDSIGGTIILNLNNKNDLIQFDKDKIIQVIRNIINNAIKYRGEKNKLVLEITCIDLGNYVKISIKDNGFGIPKDKLKHVFDKFYQADQSMTRPGEGAGLGLSITKHIIKTHKGKIEVKSHLGKGSTFVILLPIDLVADKD